MAEDVARTLKDRLRADLKSALKQTRKAEISLLRALLAAIDNAEAPAQSAGQASAMSQDFGKGAAEVGRLALSRAQLDRLLAAECDAREDAAIELERHGQSGRADSLRAEAATIKRYRG